MKVLNFVRDWWRSALARWLRRHDTAGTDAAPQVDLRPGARSPVSGDVEGNSAPAVAAPRKPRVQRQATLTALLDEIGDTFDSLRLPVEMSWLEHDTRIALRRMGPHIANEEITAWIYEKEPKIDLATPLSSMICVSFAGKEVRGDVRDTDRMVADLLFAVKLKRSPMTVEAHSGPVYQVGIAWRTHARKHIWGKWYVGVNTQTGVLRALKERWHRRVEVPKHGSYMQPVYQVPAWFAETDKQREAGRIACANHLAFAMAWWKVMDKHWKVSVRKSKDRVTWCVPFAETKYYFADRDRTVLTPSGRAAKILHYVREHGRVVRDKTVTVKEHLRGLRRFTWKGYDCAITAPKFHLFTSQAIDIAGLEDDGKVQREKMIPMSEAGQMIADLEDRQAA